VDVVNLAQTAYSVGHWRTQHFTIDGLTEGGDPGVLQKEPSQEVGAREQKSPIAGIIGAKPQ